MLSVQSRQLICPSLHLLLHAWMTHGNTTEGGPGHACIVLHSRPLPGPGQGQGVQLGSSSCERLLHWPRMSGDAEGLTFILQKQCTAICRLLCLSRARLVFSLFVKGERDCWNLPEPRKRDLRSSWSPAPKGNLLK